MKQVMEKQVHELPKQEPSEQQARFSLKVWLLKKLFQYIDGTFQTLFTAAILGGALWIAQHLWGLRLLPFNVLDTILLVVLMAFVLLVLVCLVLWLGLKQIFVKYPGILFVLGLMAFLSSRGNYPKPSSHASQTTPTASGAASEQGNDQPQS